MSRSIVGIVLAGGRSERALFVKALGRIDGELLITRAVRTLREAGAGQVIVVVAPPHAEVIAAAAEGVEIATNEHPELGMSSSLGVGMRAALAHAPDVVVFSLIDHPRVLSTTVAQLIEVAATGGARAVRPAFAGRSGHPVVVTREVAEALAVAGPELTARDVLARFDVLDFAVDDAGVVDDLDTDAELAAASVKAQ